MFDHKIIEMKEALEAKGFEVDIFCPNNNKVEKIGVGRSSYQIVISKRYHFEVFRGHDHGEFFVTITHTSYENRNPHDSKAIADAMRTQKGKQYLIQMSEEVKALIDRATF